MRLNYAKHIKSPSEDHDFVRKLGLGSLAMLFGVTSPLIVGYQMEIMRATADGQEEQLPEFREPFSLWVAGLIASVVMAILLMIPAGIFTAVMIGAAITLGMFDGGGALSAAAGLGAFFGGLGLLVIFMLLFSVLCPALLLRYTMTGQISSLFNVPQAVSDILLGPIDYLMILLVSLAGGAVASVAGGLTFGLGALPVMAYVTFVQARLMGEYHRTYMQ